MSRPNSQPTKATLIGLVIGSAAAIVAAAGPLVSATLITIGVETQVGEATGLPYSWMLPAALEGLGAVALVYIITARPAGAMRWWCVVLIGAALGAGMAAQGSHALWYDERSRSLVLPWGVKLFVSFVPPASGAAALHLLVKMAEGLIATVRLLITDAAGEQLPAPLGPRPRQPGAKADSKVERIVRTNPRVTWRVIKARTGLTDANAKRALTAARKALRSESGEMQELEPIEAAEAHANGVSRP